ncbi:MAG: hypothetical protein NT167_21205 [Verrucomicrobia bacterium]|nr:hypothetical protein [Verrucomicrobiota bacterium]
MLGHPFDDFGQGLIALAEEWGDEIDAVLVMRFDSPAKGGFFPFASTVGTQVAKLQQQTFLRIDEEALLDDVVELEATGTAPEESNRFFKVIGEFLIFIRDKYTQGPRWVFTKEFVDYEGDQREGHGVGINVNAGAVSVGQPLRKTTLLDAAVEETQVELSGHLKPAPLEGETVGLTVSPEWFGAAEELVCVNFEFG